MRGRGFPKKLAGIWSGLLDTLALWQWKSISAQVGLVLLSLYGLLVVVWDIWQRQPFILRGLSGLAVILIVTPVVAGGIEKLRDLLRDEELDIIVDVSNLSRHPLMNGDYERFAITARLANRLERDVVIEVFLQVPNTLTGEDDYWEEPRKDEALEMDFRGGGLGRDEPGLNFAVNPIQISAGAIYPTKGRGQLFAFYVSRREIDRQGGWGAYRWEDMTLVVKDVVHGGEKEARVLESLTTLGGV